MQPRHEPDSAAVTSAHTAATAVALTATVGLAAPSWVVAVRQMSGMDMGDATRLGTCASFVALWMTMMLPGAAPAVLRRIHSGGHVRAGPLFIGSYLAVWTLVGIPSMRCTGRTDLSSPEWL